MEKKESKKKDVKTIERLGYGKCRLSIAVPKSAKYAGIKSLEGKRIATTYKTVLGKFLRKNKVNAEIHEISGSVEIALGRELCRTIEVIKAEKAIRLEQ